MKDETENASEEKDEGRRMKQKMYASDSAFCLLPSSFDFGCVAERLTHRAVNPAPSGFAGSSPAAPTYRAREHDVDGRRLGCKPGYLQVRFLSCSLEEKREVRSE
jgi:hypothetical protein